MLQGWTAAALRAAWAFTALVAFGETAPAQAEGDTIALVQRPPDACARSEVALDGLLGWQLWWQPAGQAGNGSVVFRLALDSRRPALAVAAASAAPGPSQRVASESLASVLISNVPELALQLPEGVELSDPMAPDPSARGVMRVPWTPPDEQAMLQQRLLRLHSWAAVVVDQEEGRLLYAKNPDQVRSIASITKLMTAMVVLDSGAPLDEVLTIEPADVDKLKGSTSHLAVNTRLSRRDMLKLALMSSENRAAAALARSDPRGREGFVQAMNEKAAMLGMRDSRFLDPTGLNPGNRATAYDLALMVNGGYQYPLIREFTTNTFDRVALHNARARRLVSFHNSNGLMWSEGWEIGLSKTGYINEAGRCLVLQATIAARPVIIVLLDSLGSFARIADANRIKRWIEELNTTSGPRRM